MGLTITAPRYSFVQFSETDSIDSCNFPSYKVCLPVYDDNDVQFQWFVDTDTPSEADALCTLDNSGASVSIIDDCGEGDVVTFSNKPIRYRLSDTQVLFEWPFGLPGMTAAISFGQCFRIQVEVGGVKACSNCFQRIPETCDTSVIEYGSNENSFGFNYCGSGSVNDIAPEGGECQPFFVSFTNQSTLSIPYTADMLAKYGSAPNVSVWIYNDDGTLSEPGIQVKLDTFPPTHVNIDFGGNASGVVKIT